MIDPITWDHFGRPEGVTTIALSTATMILTIAASVWPSRAAPVRPSFDTTALIDRIVHHAEIVVIEGDSYRRREAEADIKSRRRTRTAESKKRTS